MEKSAKCKRTAEVCFPVFTALSLKGPHCGQFNIFGLFIEKIPVLAAQVLQNKPFSPSEEDVLTVVPPPLPAPSVAPPFEFGSPATQCQASPKLKTKKRHTKSL